jgi:dTDP-4-dehydrorhamnose 3,5-epimerase-like enzyme
MPNHQPEAEPRVINGGLSVDDRGTVAFVNDFAFAGVRRFYTVSNHAAGSVRAWHAHRREAKFIAVLRGAAAVGAVKIDCWENPSSAAPVRRFVLSAQKPAVLCIPAGYANGFMSLTADTLLAFFSTATLEESRADDVRYDARLWDIWKVGER